MSTLSTEERSQAKEEAIKELQQLLRERKTYYETERDNNGKYGSMIGGHILKGAIERIQNGEIE